MTTIAMAVACWGDYWKRYGAAFVASIEAMNPRFDEVVIVSDLDINVPHPIRVVRPRSSVKLWDWFNEAVDACSSEWITIGAVDDLMFPDALVDLPLRGDLVGIACMCGDTFTESPGIGHWNNLLAIDNTLIYSSCFMRREIFQRFPWRRVFHSDWMQWCEMRHSNIAVSFDHTPRFRYLCHVDSHSAIPSPLGHRQIREMKRMLPTGRVVPGPDWPPLGGDWREQREPVPSQAKEFWLRLRKSRNR